jgi:hypothetical protein
VVAVVIVVAVAGVDSTGIAKSALYNKYEDDEDGGKSVKGREESILPHA